MGGSGCLFSVMTLSHDSLTLSWLFFSFTDRAGVLSNKSGCGDTGLLDAFQDYWIKNRSTVERDAAQLFSGTGLECSGAFAPLDVLTREEHAARIQVMA